MLSQFRQAEKVEEWKGGAGFKPETSGPWLFKIQNWKLNFAAFLSDLIETFKAQDSDSKGASR